MSGTLPGMINGGTLLTSPTTLGAEERLLAVGTDGQTAAKTASSVRTMIDFTSQAAAAAPVQSVAGRTGTITLTKSDVGLGNVENTTDANKPISTATQTALDAKADLVGGLVPSAQIPAIAITEYLGSVVSQSAMLALAGQKGDWAIRTDLGTTWVITGNDPTLLASWTALSYPTAPVTSVNSQTGAVTLAAADVGAAAASHNQAWSTITGTPTTRAGYGITDAQPLDAELTAIAGLTSAADRLPYFTGTETAALADLTSFGRSLIDDADAATARSTLGLAIGTDVQAFDADLSALAALTGTNDIYYRSGASTWSPVAIGANLTFSSGTLSASGGGASPQAVKALSGFWYNSQDPETNGSAVAIAANTLYLLPFRFDTAETWDAIYTHVNTTGAGTVARLGIYDPDLTASPPTFNLLVDAGTVSVATTGSKSITGLARSLAAGKLVFLAILSDGAWTNLGATGSVLRQPLLGGHSMSINGGLATHFTKSQAYGSLPSTVTSVTTVAGNLPSSGLRI